MKDLESFSIASSVYPEELVRVALEIVCKIDITKENPTMEIPIKGKLILHFDPNVTENQIIELELAN